MHELVHACKHAHIPQHPFARACARCSLTRVAPFRRTPGAAAHHPHAIESQRLNTNVTTAQASAELWEEHVPSVRRPYTHVDY